MFQLKYLMCVSLIIYGHLVAQDASAAQPTQAASPEQQTLPAEQTVRPVVDPTQQPQEEPKQDAPSEEQPQEAAVVPENTETSQQVQVEAPAPAQVEQATVSAIEVPEPPKPVSPEDKEDEFIEPKGIDTVNIEEPQGNWLFKRIWWQKSKEVYGKIRDRVDKIVESRMHFFKERVKLDREVLDPFYVEIGFDAGALRQNVANLQSLLKEDEKRDATLTEKARERLASLQEDKAAIAKLSESVSGVQDLDKKLDEALEELMNQINLARTYESEAWQRLDSIAEELNDKKAREHYYVIAALWRNVKDIGNYIQGPFAQHFVKLAQTTVQNVKEIKNIAALLRSKGFGLDEKLEQAAQEPEAQSSEDEDEDVWPKKEELGWGAWLWKKLTGWYS